jgi:hypothetical protein
MTQIQRAVTAVCILSCSIATSAGTLAAPPQDSPAIESFNQRVQDYVALHRRLEGPVLTTTLDMRHVRQAMDALAARITQERKDARQGEFFTREVAGELKARIREGCGGDLQTLLAIVQEETPPGLSAPRVGSRWPTAAAHGMIPPAVLCRMPQLPVELQFGFVGPHLVLWDVHADLIVDVLPNAIAMTVP